MIPTGLGPGWISSCHRATPGFPAETCSSSPAPGKTRTWYPPRSNRRIIRTWYRGRSCSIASDTTWRHWTQSTMRAHRRFRWPVPWIPGWRALRSWRRVWARNPEQTCWCKRPSWWVAQVWKPTRRRRALLARSRKPRSRGTRPSLNRRSAATLAGQPCPPAATTRTWIWPVCHNIIIVTSIEL